MTVFESAMLAEIVRSGINAVPVGQMEAARSNGLTYTQAMVHIILPQAFKAMIPPIVSQFISLVKDTSLATIILLPELTYHSQIIYGQNSNYMIPMFVALAVLYFVVNYALSLISRLISRRLSSGVRYRRDLQDYLIEPGKRSAGLSSKPRLTLREKDKGFFNKYIQGIDLDGLMDLNLSTKDEPQQNMARNAKAFLDKIEATFGNDEKGLEEFAGFLVQRCYLVVVATSNQDSAFRIFSVMNSRGLPLLPTDIIKSEVIGQIDQSEQQKYTDIWENLEVALGRDDFNNLFAHIRMIFSRVKAKKTLLEEFKASVLPKFAKRPEQLIDEIIAPYTESYASIKNAEYQGEPTEATLEINATLKWLNKIDNSDWMPPAILYFSENNASPEKLSRFVTKLERLAAYMHIASVDVNARIRRFARIISEIQNDEELTEIELKPEEIKDFRNRLNGDIYTMNAKRRNYFILRLDSFVSDGAAEYNPRVLTIEHVLPQTIDSNSEWQQLWVDDPKTEPPLALHDQWVHKIANLVPLARRANSAAHNFDFAVKKEKYFTGKEGTSSYVLTTQVLNTTVWDVAHVEQRQKELLSTFYKKWALQLDDTED
jgi:hypothetical protein